TAGNMILTLYEKRVDAQDLPFFLGLMTHLADRGLNCPQPLPDRSGQPLREIAGRSGAFFSFLAGTCTHAPTVAQCRAAGEALGRLHVLADDFAMERANALGLEGWQRLHGELAGAPLPTVAPGYNDVITDELDFQARAWPAHLPRGTLHADMFPNNVFFLDGQLSGIIDFYFACTDVLLYDLAITANAWCFEASTGEPETHDDQAGHHHHGTVRLNEDKLAALVSGYAALRPGVAQELGEMCTLCRAAALRFFLTRAIDWLTTPATALVERLDPAEYIDRLNVWRAIAAGPTDAQAKLFSPARPAH
ncbi:MAG: homoserine kinase, partial [Pseudomonadota bacterium]